MDKERWKCNIVVHNLKEVGGDTHNFRMADDRSRLAELFKEALHLHIKITKLFIAGQFNSEKPPLLIVTLDQSWKTVQDFLTLKLTHTEQGKNGKKEKIEGGTSHQDG